jgi:hypothetical protein
MAYVGTPSNQGSVRNTLASVIQGEAGNQGPTGMLAVGAVIQNRANSNFGGYGGDLMSQMLARNQFQGQAAPTSASYAAADQILSGNYADPTGGATSYANPGASSASWARNLNSSNSLQIGDHFFTDNQNGAPFTPNFSGSGGTIADGSPDTSSGLGAGSSVSANPSGTDPGFGDITQFPVAGVNAPANGGGTGAGVGNDQGTPNLGGGVSQSSGPVGDVSPDQPMSSPVKVTLQPGVTKAVGDWISNIESSFGSGLASTLKAAETATANYFGGLTNWVVRGLLILLGIVLIAIGLIVLMWDHGGKETVVNLGKVATA